MKTRLRVKKSRIKNRKTKNGKTQNRKGRRTRGGATAAFQRGSTPSTSEIIRIDVPQNVHFFSLGLGTATVLFKKGVPTPLPNGQKGIYFDVNLVNSDSQLVAGLEKVFSNNERRRLKQIYMPGKNGVVFENLYRFEHPEQNLENPDEPVERRVQNRGPHYMKDLQQFIKNLGNPEELTYICLTHDVRVLKMLPRYFNNPKLVVVTSNAKDQIEYQGAPKSVSNFTYQSFAQKTESIDVPLETRQRLDTASFSGIDVTRISCAQEKLKLDANGINIEGKSIGNNTNLENFKGVVKIISTVSTTTNNPSTLVDLEATIEH
jgi:hypothetical protein